MDLSALFGLVTSGAGLLAGKSRKGHAHDAWQTAAETYGLLHKPSSFWSGPKLSGSLSGNELTVDIKDRNTASAATRFRLATPSQNLGLRFRKRSFWNSLRPRFTVGDEVFDKQVVVEGRNKLAIQEYLTPARRTAIQSFVSSFKGAVITDDEIALNARGNVKNADEMLGAIDAMMQVASVLSEPAHSTSVGQSAGTLVASISPIAAAGVVALESDRESERMRTQDQEPAHAYELDAESGPDPEHEAEPEPVSEPGSDLDPGPGSVLESDSGLDLDTDPEPAVVRADDSNSPSEPVVEANVPSSPHMPQENTPPIEEFCATVFAPGALSFAANQTFKASYEGERVNWTGRLESVTPFMVDFDFRSGRGTKLVVTILESEASGARNVQAVVGLPPGIEGLERRIGQPVSFSGRLLKVDGLAKRVVIADAELLPSQDRG